MTVIRQEDFIASVAGAVQYMSYYRPVDFIVSLAKAYEREQSLAARDAMAQILINSRICAEGHRPVCQVTGIVNAFVKLGVDVRFAGPAGGSPLVDLQAMVDDGVRRAYLDPLYQHILNFIATPPALPAQTPTRWPSIESSPCRC